MVAVFVHTQLQATSNVCLLVIVGSGSKAAVSEQQQDCALRAWIRRTQPAAAIMLHHVELHRLCMCDQVMAAAAETLTPVVLELGGKDAFIVCEDADLKTVSHQVVSDSVAGRAVQEARRNEKEGKSLTSLYEGPATSNKSYRMYRASSRPARLMMKQAARIRQQLLHPTSLSRFMSAVC